MKNHHFLLIWTWFNLILPYKRKHCTNCFYWISETHVLNTLYSIYWEAEQDWKKKKLWIAIMFSFFMCYHLFYFNMVITLNMTFTLLTNFYVCNILLLTTGMMLYRRSLEDIHFACVHSQSLQCLTLCDPMGCSPPGSSVHGPIQARILECLSLITLFHLA